MCCCPGRNEHHSDGVARSRNLDEDLMLIRDWRPDQVISLVEEQGHYKLTIEKA